MSRAFSASGRFSTAQLAVPRSSPAHLAEPARLRRPPDRRRAKNTLSDPTCNYLAGQRMTARIDGRILQNVLCLGLRFHKRPFIHSAQIGLKRAWAHGFHWKAAHPTNPYPLNPPSVT